MAKKPKKKEIVNADGTTRLLLKGKKYELRYTLFNSIPRQRREIL